MEEFKTPGGKTLVPYLCPQSAHVKIKLVEGGILPEVLSGIFTSLSLGTEAIRTYLLVNKEEQTKKENEKVEKKAFVKSLSNNEEK
jgi:hypothetical protein|tara:strand:+ start:1478 stop:1735 length:258 start_codon:yes stop_codon:yes gene_type:complete